MSFLWIFSILSAILVILEADLVYFEKVIGMANIYDYIDWRGDLSIQSSPFNEVDNLILTQLIYLDFTEIVPYIQSGKKIHLNEAAELYFIRFSKETIEQMPVLKQNVSKLLLKMQQSTRYGALELSDYINEIDPLLESQFSAMKIGLPDGSIFLSFSGTDETVIGWKENFNMSYLSETPGQKKSVEYIEKTVPFYKNKLRVGGHSKGGNLAIYAAMYSKKSIQKRILEIYNNDGPGFTGKMILREGYANILPRIRTIIPQSSIIGMLLEHEEEMDIILSSNHGILQHDAFSWEVIGTKFVHLTDLTNESLTFTKTIKSWLAFMDEEQRKQFVDALFTILDKAGIDNTEQLYKLNLSSFYDLIKAAEGLNKQEQSVLRKTIGLLIQIGSANVFKNTKFEELRKNRKNKVKLQLDDK